MTMRFLCLPGAYGSSDKFQVQLAPILKELTEDGTAQFHFIHGPCKAVPPPGFEDYFGAPPYYRFIEPDKDVEKTHSDDVLARIRDFPQCETAEDTMRELMREGIATTHKSTDRAIKYLSEIVQKRGPFDGIIGYSEGATVASTFMLHEQRRQKRSGHTPAFKYGIFFAGWPPVDPKTHALVLSDESDERIEARTLHISESILYVLRRRMPVPERQPRESDRLKGKKILTLPCLVGSLDPYVDGSMALYNMCDPDTAYLFDHAKGHTLPRDKETIKELGDIVRDAMADFKEEGLL